MVTPITVDCITHNVDIARSVHLSALGVTEQEVDDGGVSARHRKWVCVCVWKVLQRLGQESVCGAPARERKNRATCARRGVTNVMRLAPNGWHNG